MDIKKLKESAAKLREAATKAEAKFQAADKKKSADAKKLKEAAEKCKMEADEADKKVEEAEEAVADPDDEGTAADGDDHADEQQDIELIKKMIAEYLGDDAKGMEQEEMEALQCLGKEAMEAHKEMGASEKEAYEHAGNAMKLAHHMSKKEKTEADDDADGASGGDGKGKVPPKKKPTPPAKGDGGDDGDDDAAESHKESKKLAKLQASLLEAQGRIATLEAQEKAKQLAKYVDEKLAEAKQPRLVTTKFREAAGPFKSQKDFDTKWKVFSAGFTNEGQAPELDLGDIFTEKAAPQGDGSAADGSDDKMDFSDCAEGY